MKYKVRTGLAIVVIILIIGLAFAPSINANVDIISTLIFEEQNDTQKISCKYFTMKGIEEVEKEISVKDAEHLSQLMDSSDFDAIATELAHLDLVPESMSIHQIKEIISGDYGREHYSKFQDKIKNNHLIDDNKKRNIFCSVSGDAGYNELATPTLLILMDMFLLLGLFFGSLDYYFQQFSWYPTVVVDNEYLYIKYGLFFSLAFAFLGAGILIKMIFNYIPPKAMAYSIAILEDNSNVTASGLLGQWNIHNPEILLHMIGFLGLWVNYERFSCEFKGFALYVAAKGIDN